MLAFIRLMSKTSSVIVWPSSLFKSLVSHCDFLGYEDAACKVHVTLFFVLFFVIIISLEKDNFRPLDFRIIFPNSVLLLFLRVNYIFFLDTIMLGVKNIVIIFAVTAAQDADLDSPSRNSPIKRKLS